MARNIKEERDRTMDSVSRTTCWCLTIALHQEFGVGKARQERLAAAVSQLQEKNYATMIYSGRDAADREREAWTDGICENTFRVPLLRGTRNRREEQIRMAGNEAASIAWQLYAKACIDVLGFGPNRLKKLHEEARKNYEQFNEWAHEDLDLAMDRLKRCAEAALQEEMQVVEDDPKQDEKVYKELKEELRRTRKLKAVSKLGQKPGYAVISNQKIEEIAANAMTAIGRK